MLASWTKEEKKNKDNKVMTQIHLYLSNDILQDVLKKKSTVALWLKFEQLFMTRSLPSKLYLKQRLYSHRLSKGKSIINPISTFKESVADLETMEVKYEEEDLGLILLCSLPSLYSTFRDTILHSRETLTLKEVYESLRSKETMKQLVNGFEAKVEGLIARGRSQEKGFGNSDRGESKSKSRNKSYKHIIGDCISCRIRIRRLQIKKESNC